MPYLMCQSIIRAKREITPVIPALQQKPGFSYHVRMTYRGHIENGMIVLDEAAHLPEGAEVVVALRSTRKASLDPFGICADGPKVSEEDIAEARREMWENFPRNDI